MKISISRSGALRGGYSCDGALSEGLAGLLGHLRGRPYGCLDGVPEQALRTDADRFVGRLAEHLRYSEETLFPALREVEPGSACDIKELEEDHRLFHRCARDLAFRIREGDKEEACGVARSFLALLLDHFHRETEGVERIVRSLDVLDARRLSKALMEEAPAAGPDGFQDPLR